jgi:hypothetical protein
MPVMLVYGDSDMFRPEHIVQFYQLLGGGLKDAGWMREHMSQNRLAILPDLTHYEMFASPLLAHTVLPFLNGQSGAKSWPKCSRANSDRFRSYKTPASDTGAGVHFYQSQSWNFD